MNIQPRLQEELWDAIRSNYEKENFTGAIQDAIYFLTEVLRQKSESEGDGVPLVGQALGGDNPRVKLTKLQTDSDKNVQVGFATILRGVYQGIRNPRAHDKFEDTSQDADAIIIFVDYLLRQIEAAKSPFDKDEFISRVMDENFVTSERYCELIFDEIPKRQHFNTFLGLYELRERWHIYPIGLFLKKFFSSIDPEVRTQIAAVISRDLRGMESNRSLTSIVGAIGPHMWIEFSEVSRLRIENQLIASVRVGQFRNNECKAGVLGSWSPRIFPQFTLRDEMLTAILTKLYAEDIAEIAYLSRYILGPIDTLFDKPPENLEIHFRNRIKRKEAERYKLIRDALLWNNQAWSDDTKAMMKEFDAELPDDFDDDTPF